MTVHVTLQLQATGPNTTGFKIPDEVVEQLGGGRRPKVVAIVGTFTMRTSIARMGGTYWLGVSAARRAEGSLEAGGVYDLEITLDTAPRVVGVPIELADALAGDLQAKAAWDKLSYSHQRRHAEAITGAKRPDTRQRRVVQTLHALRTP